jgi:group I intron endonuclease
MKQFKDLVRKEYLYNGIYKIVNVKNNKFYIGSCASKEFLYKRLFHHINDLKNGKHINKYLQNSFNKYGEDSFFFEIIEPCEAEKCIEREQYWIDLLKPNYNSCLIAGNTKGVKVSLETKNKISEKNKLWYQTEKGIAFKNKLSEMKKGKKGLKHSEESKQMLSKKLKGRVFSKETIEKMKIPRPSLLKPIIDITTGEITTCKNYSEKHKLNISYVQSLARGERTSKKHNIKYE